MKNSKISILSRVLMFITSCLFFGAIFFPLWRIELDAPQYPEGLVLQLFADKIGGDVDVINGLNHYIGMKTLHTDNFFEFSIIKYILIGLAIIGIVFTIIGMRKGLYAFFTIFLIFIIVSGIDFYRWNYNYGHDLNPNAAIKVPGMAYTPPLLGYKQLLNFGAYSIPDTGGYLLITAGLLLLLAVLKERHSLNKLKKMNPTPILLLILSTTFFSCNSNQPKPIKLNSDSCDFCKMTISNPKFAAELITDHGRYYKFDDLACLIEYTKTNTSVTYKSFFVNDYLANNKLIPAEKAYYLIGGTINGPMGGKFAAFSTNADAKSLQSKLQAQPTTWEEIYKNK